MTTRLIFPNKQAIAVYAAMRFIEIAQNAIHKNGRFSIALSGGGTPQAFYELLAMNDYANQIQWQHVHLFWGDERSVPPTSDGSNFKQVREALIDHVPIPPENVWRVRGELEPADGARDYAQQLERFSPQSPPRFDIALMGMGSDGHTASLFPNSPLEVEGSAIPVVANYGDRPARRVSLTPSVFNAAHNVWFMVSGAGKAETIAKVFSENNPLLYPAQRIRPIDGNLTWFLDVDSAEKLPR